jgi:hypothetical protein
VCAGVDPDQQAHPYHLIRIFTVRFFINWVVSDQRVNSADPDQMELMCWLIWIYTGHIRIKMHIYGVTGYEWNSKGSEL